MKKVLVLMLVLGMATLASATTISLQGAGTTISGLLPGLVTINILTDAGLIGLDAIGSVAGGDVITDTVKIANGAAYGWDEVGFPIDPVGLGTASVMLGGANFNGNNNSVVGFVTVNYTGGTQVVSLEPRLVVLMI
jgi:hypothetical protein